MNNKNRHIIQGMFSDIAGTYDRANSVLSLGLHHYWKNLLVKKAMLKSSGGKVLDICTGTGDILKKFRNLGISAFGVDFTLPMLQIYTNTTPNDSRVAQADALKLPFTENCFEIVTVSYGVRNFENLELGLQEILRVLRPGGTLFILEFGEKPSGLIGLAISCYEKHVLPALGGLISGRPNAYRYLAQSSNEFPSGNKLINICEKIGFKGGKFLPLSFGATYLYEISR